MKRTTYQALTPMVSDTTRRWIESHGRLHATASYLMEQWPAIYRETLANLRGRIPESVLHGIVDACRPRKGHPLDGEAPGKAIRRVIDLTSLTRLQAGCLELWGTGFWFSTESEEGYVGQLK